jgi:Peptidase M15
MTDRSQVAVENISLAKLKPEDLIAPHFKVWELTKSEVAARRGVDNSFPSDAEAQAAVFLARNVLEVMRAEFGAFSPNSVFRSQATERVLKQKPAGWISTSQHTQGCACDVEIAGVTTLELAHWASRNLETFDQIICECYDPRQGPNSGWVHISLKAPGRGVNRRQLLSYVRDADSERWVYVSGLRESGVPC